MAVDQVANCSVLVKALDTNADPIGVGGSSIDVDTDASRLEANQRIIFKHVGNLSSIYIDASSAGDGVSWILLSV